MSHSSSKRWARGACMRTGRVRVVAAGAVILAMAGALANVAPVVAASPSLSSGNVATEEPTVSDDLETIRAQFVGIEAPAENETCTTCHTAEGESALDVACAASKHAGLLCVTCHDDDDVLDELHAKTKAKRMPMRLKKTTVEPETCGTCHLIEGDDFAELAAEKPLVDANGLEVNAHEVIAAEQHEGVTCVNCHEMHDTTMPDEQAQKVCATCHHAQVYECFTCHDHA